MFMVRRTSLLPRVFARPVQQSNPIGQSENVNRGADHASRAAERRSSVQPIAIYCAHAAVHRRRAPWQLTLGASHCWKRVAL